MTRYDIAKFYGYNSVEEYDEAEKRNNKILEDLKKQKPSKYISHGVLSPEEQELQDTIDKFTTKISSQLGIPRWQAESAVRAMIKEFEGK